MSKKWRWKAAAPVLGGESVISTTNKLPLSAARPSNARALDSDPIRSFTFRSMTADPDDGQLHTLGLPERLRADTRGIDGVYADLYRRVDALLRELSNPNLHDIANMNHRVAIAATASVTVGHAAFDAAVKNWPHERFTLRNGILVIREPRPA